MTPGDGRGPAASPGEGVRDWTLRDFWGVLTRRRWLIAGAVLVATVSTAMFSLTLTRQYRATCTISIERNNVRAMSNDLDRAESGSYAYESFYNTQYRILGSDAVLREVLDDLDLRSRPETLGLEPDPQTLLESESAKVLARALEERELPPMRPELREDLARDEKLLRALRGRLAVDPVLGSNLVNIHFESPDPRFAASVANAVSDAYIKFSRSEKLELAHQSEGFFAEQAQEMREQHIEAEERLKKYARQHGIVTGDDRDAARQQLADLQQRYTEALSDVARSEAALEALRAGKGLALEEVRRHHTVEKLSRDIVEKERDLTSLSSRLGPDYPEVQRLELELANSRELLKETVEEVSGQVQESRRVAFAEARARAERLEALVAGARERVDRLEQAMIEYEQLRAEAQQKKAMVDELRERRLSMLLAASMGENAAQNVRVINPAVTPDRPHRPNKTRMVLIGLLLGLFAGVGVSVLLEALDESIKTGDELAQALEINIVGEIPAHRAEGQRPAILARGRREPERGVVSATNPRSAEAEAYRELRTAYLTLSEGKRPHTLLVTSAVPSEGKSTTALNLAATLGQIGRRVLLVDTDLRRPVLHRALRGSGERGVSQVLHAGDATEPATIQTTSLQNVDLLAAGPVPPNPAEMLESESFAKLVEMLREKAGYDVVIFDSPPVLSVVDPVLVGRHLDAAILVVRAGKISRRVARQALQKLRAGQTKVLGAALNAVDLREGGYGHYRYYHYSEPGAHEGKRGEGRGRKRRPTRRDWPASLEADAEPREGEERRVQGE